MVVRMAKRALVLAPFVIVALWLVDGPTWALSGAVGIAMTVGNLWAAARIIGDPPAAWTLIIHAPVRTAAGPIRRTASQLAGRRPRWSL